MPSRHAEISPSTFEYREMCDFWAPDNTKADEEVMAKRGTAIHAAVEKNDMSLCLEQEDIPIAKLCLKYLEHVRASYDIH